MSELRVALIMGGGVSLGSFSAGALTQLMKLLQHVERGPAKIDVVTGASAGSMTLGVAIHHLFRGATLEEIEASLYGAWVDDISLDALCPPDMRAHALPSLFSDHQIRRIAEQVIDLHDWSNREPHPLLADGLVASFALTNLNGIPVRAEGQLIRQPNAGGASASGASSVFADAVQTTFHHDAIRFVLRREDTPQARADAASLRARMLLPWNAPGPRAGWKTFREAAVASGAFPGAFPPVRLTREETELQIWPDEIEASSFTFDYLDGGILRNEPLREAIHLAAERDGDSEAERVFILIDPNVSGTNEVYPLSFNQALVLKQENAGDGTLRAYRLAAPGYLGRLGGVMARFGGVLASQATFRDWLKAARVNSRVEWRDEAEALIRELRPAEGSGAEVRADTLLRRIYAEKVARSLGREPAEADDEPIGAAIERDLRRRADGEPIGFSTKLMLLLDLISNLREKRKLNMVAITPASVPEGTSAWIAGNFLANFGGFFDRRFRDHDFAKGAYIADLVLNEPVSGARRLLQAGAVPRLQPPTPIRPDPTYGGLTPEVRGRFETLLREHVHTLLSQLGVPRLLRGTVAGRVLGSARGRLAAENGGRTAFFLLRVHNARDLYFARGAFGDERRASGDVLETVVGLRRTVEGGDRCTIFGPNILANGDGVAHLELRKPRGWLRGSQPVSRLELREPFQPWFEAAYRCGIPVLEVQLSNPPRSMQLSAENIRG
jgi:predicted acylesterase/phospholipase RssA